MALSRRFSNQEDLHSRHHTWDVVLTLKRVFKDRSCIWAEVENWWEFGQKWILHKGVDMNYWKRDWANHSSRWPLVILTLLYTCFSNFLPHWTRMICRSIRVSEHDVIWLLRLGPKIHENFCLDHLCYLLWVKPFNMSYGHQKSPVQKPTYRETRVIFLKKEKITLMPDTSATVYQP